MTSNSLLIHTFESIFTGHRLQINATHLPVSTRNWSISIYETKTRKRSIPTHSASNGLFGVSICVAIGKFCIEHFVSEIFSTFNCRRTSFSLESIELKLFNRWMDDLKNRSLHICFSSIFYQFLLYQLCGLKPDDLQSC